MSEGLIPTIPDETRMRLMLAIALPSGESKGLAEIAEELDVTPADLVSLLNEPSFLKGVKAISMAQANLSFHSEGIRELIKLASGAEEERNKLTAIRTLAQITGNLKNTHSVDVRVTFDDLRKRQTDDPLSGLFSIHSTDVLEGEVDDASD